MPRTWLPAYGPELKKMREQRPLCQQDVVEALCRLAPETVAGADDTIAGYERPPKSPRRKTPPPPVIAGLARVFEFADAEAFLAELERRAANAAPDLDDPEPQDLRWLPLEDYLERLEAAITDPECGPGPATLHASVGKADVLLAAMRRFYEAAPSARRPHVERVVVLRLAESTISGMIERGELDPRFGEELGLNLGKLATLLHEHDVTLDVRSSDRLPAFHGFLYGDHLFRGTWQVGRAGTLDAYTMLEHRTLQRDPEAHAEFHLVMQPDFALPAKIGLRLGEYAIFGSGPMAVRGLRDATDIEVIAKREACLRLTATHADKVQPHAGGVSKIQLGPLTIYDGWPAHVGSVDDLVRRAEVVLGVPFVQLRDVWRWKVTSDRHASWPDVERIDLYHASLRVPEPPAPQTSRSSSLWRAELGPALRALRGERTLSALAKAVGLDEETLRAYERGEQEPRARALTDLAKGLQLGSVPELIAALEEQLEDRKSPGLPAHVKVRQLLRALTHPAHHGLQLVVVAGTGDMTQMVLSRAYQGGTRSRPVITGVRLRRLSDETVARLGRLGALDPTFGDELRANIAAIRAVLSRNGLSLEEEPLDDRPVFHGYVIGDHAFVGRWAKKNGHWHVRTPIEHVTRQSGLWPEVWASLPARPS